MSTPTPAPYAPQVITLSNGITLINVYTPDTTTVTVQLVVRAGSRDEVPSTAGLAHFEEHMLFNGTKKTPDPDEIIDRLSSGGGFTNAFTSEELVSYFAIGPEQDLETIADTLCDMVSNPLNDKEHMDRERGAVLEELGNRQQDTFTWCFDALQQVAFGGKQSMAWSAIGFEDNVKSVTPKEMNEYHARFYDPHQTALIVCGSRVLDEDTAEKLLQSYPNGHRGARTPTKWGQGQLFLGKSLPVPAGQRPVVDALVAVPGIPVNDPDTIAAHVLTMLLSGGNSARLEVLHRKNPKLAHEMFVYNRQYSDAGQFILGVRADLPQAEKAVSEIVKELDRLARTPVSRQELKRITTLASADLLGSTEHTDDLAGFYARRWGNAEPTCSPSELAAQYEKVSSKDIQRVAARLMAGLKDARLTFVHQVDPATGKNALGKTLDEEGTALLRAATSLAERDRGLQ